MSFVRTAILLSAGPLVWALHFLAIYGYTGMACARGLAGSVPWAVAIVTLAAIVVCVTVIALAPRTRATFEQWLAIALASIALVAIAWEALPVLLVRPCA